MLRRFTTVVALAVLAALSLGSPARRLPAVLVFTITRPPRKCRPMKAHSAP